MEPARKVREYGNQMMWRAVYSRTTHRFILSAADQFYNAVIGAVRPVPAPARSISSRPTPPLPSVAVGDGSPSSSSSICQCGEHTFACGEAASTRSPLYRCSTPLSVCVSVCVSPRQPGHESPCCMSAAFQSIHTFFAPVMLYPPPGDAVLTLAVTSSGVPGFCLHRRPRPR